MPEEQIQTENDGGIRAAIREELAEFFTSDDGETAEAERVARETERRTRERETTNEDEPIDLGQVIREVVGEMFGTGKGPRTAATTEHEHDGDRHGHPGGSDEHNHKRWHEDEDHRKEHETLRSSRDKAPAGSRGLLARWFKYGE